MDVGPASTEGQLYRVCAVAAGSLWKWTRWPAKSDAWDGGLGSGCPGVPCLESKAGFRASRRPRGGLAMARPILHIAFKHVFQALAGSAASALRNVRAIK